MFTINLRTITLPAINSRIIAVGLLSLLLTGTVVGGVACSESEPGKDPQPLASRDRPTRVVLVTLDTMRLDTFERADGRIGAMPFTREWARKGIILDQHYAASSSTQPTHASLLTGLHPWQHGVSRNGQVLAREHLTLTEIFKERGYRTGAVVASFPLHQSFGFDQGFERFDDDFDVASAARWYGREVPGGAFFSLGHSINEKAIEMVDAFGAVNQFLWFHYFDLHQPYGDAEGKGEIVKLGEIYAQIENGSATVGAMVERAKQQYEADARVLDRLLDQLIQRLYADADDVDTHLLVVSDHGESFGEFGSLGHGKRITEDLIHVPCFLISPAVTPGRIDVPNGSIDIPVTLLSLAGLEGLAGSGLDVTNSATEERNVFGMRRTFETPFHELRLDGKRHLLEDFEFFSANQRGVTTGNANRVQSTSESSSEPEQAKVRALFGVFEQELAGAGVASTLDDEARAALEALGYVQ